MSEIADAAFLHIARAVTRVPPEERAGVIEQACVMMLGRLSEDDRRGAMVLLRHRFTPREHRNGAAPPGVHDPPASSAPPGADPVLTLVQDPGADPVHHPSGEGGLGGGFEQFWGLYPRKRAKDKALKAWKQLKIQDGAVSEILQALKLQREWGQWKRGVIPLPGTWINQRRWRDAPDEVLADAPVSMNLASPIAWSQPGCLIQQWNALAPGDDARGKGCTAVESVDAALLALECEALTWQPAESWWAETFAEMNASKRKLLARCPTTEGGLGVICTVDRFLSPGDGTRRRLAARVHDGELRDA